MNQDYSKCIPSRLRFPCAVLAITVVFTLLWICGVGVAHAGTTLPQSISNGSYYIINDSTPSITGTTLNVQSMLDNAANSNLSAAVFDATNLTFIGPLTITLPSTAWTTNNIPLRLLILDGTSGVSLQVYIAVTGIVVLPFKAVLLHLRANL